MGVSGSGKTTLGRAIAQSLGWPFVDADDLHPQTNVEKMARGIALDDADRAPWLASVGQQISQWRLSASPGVLACSALKRAYRDRLRLADPGLHFVYIQGDPALLAQRMRTRHGHYMPARLLQSQLETLEEPGSDERAIRVSAADPVERSLAIAIAALGGKQSGPGLSQT